MMAEREMEQVERWESARWRTIPRARWLPLATAALLAVACLSIHGRSLGSGWKFDDPALLRYALSHDAWQVFTQPEVMRALSYANLTPWNAAFYQLGLPWFGLSPAGHYAHLLGVIAATAFATWMLLVRRLGWPAATLAAAWYLAAAPTAAVGMTLMTGHYAYGLLFTVLALACHAHAVEQGHWLAPVATAVLYGLACLCKELYVPLVALLLCWPVPMSWRRRLCTAAPLLAVALAYVALRVSVLGGVGGYGWLDAPEAAALRPLEVAAADAARSLVPLLFGDGIWGRAAAATTALAMLIGAVAAMRRRAIARGRLLFAALGLLLMLAPVLPMFLHEFPFGRERLLYLIGWAGAVGSAWVVHRHALGTFALLLALVPMLVSQRGVIERYDRRGEPGPTQFAFVARSDADELLVPHAGADLGYLLSMAEARALASGRPGATIVRDDEELVALGPQRGRLAWAWNDACTCLQRLGPDYDARTGRFEALVRAGAGRPAAASFDVEDRGRVKHLRWRVEGLPGRAYLDVHEFGRVELARPAGALSFGLDSTLRIPGQVAHLRFTVVAEDGALIRSPLLSLPLSQQGGLEWRSGSASGAARSTGAGLSGLN